MYVNRQAGSQAGSQLGIQPGNSRTKCLVSMMIIYKKCSQLTKLHWRMAAMEGGSFVVDLVISAPEKVTAASKQVSHFHVCSILLLLLSVWRDWCIHTAYRIRMYGNCQLVTDIQIFSNPHRCLKFLFFFLPIWRHANEDNESIWNPPSLNSFIHSFDTFPFRRSTVIIVKREYLNWLRAKSEKKMRSNKSFIGPSINIKM